MQIQALVWRTDSDSSGSISYTEFAEEICKKEKPLTSSPSGSHHNVTNNQGGGMLDVTEASLLKKGVAVPLRVMAAEPADVPQDGF